MTIFQALILSIVQGITEFLPISSKGHLNLVSALMGLTPSLSLDIFLNTATLVSVLIYFRKQVPYFIKNLKYIVVGTLPAVIAGFLFKHRLESLVTNLHVYPYFFLVTSLYLFSTKFLKSKDRQLTYAAALAIGTFQALALLPGISRSGSTIFAGLLMGLSPLEAFNFSFALFIPASFGALLLDLKDASLSGFFHPVYLFSFVVTFLVGLAAISVLKKLLTSKHFWYFGIYTLLLAIFLFIARV
ncbi:MAG TPA: undecaprenyl-diphosphate phosphatase [Patescibacteria group bacterium]